MKLGCLASKFTEIHHSKAAMLKLAFNQLGAPPSRSSDYTSAVIQALGSDNWGMMLNDELGDCMIADCGHRIMLSSANTGKMVQLSDADIALVYEQVAGYNPDDPTTDAGTDAVTLLRFLETTGMYGTKVLNAAPLHTHEMDGIKWAIELMGACRLCINLPQSAMNQFKSGQTLDVVLDDGGLVGGHDILAVKYDNTFFYAISWGKMIAVTPAFLAKYLFEAHAEIWSDWFTAYGDTPKGDTLTKLLADLKAVEDA